MILIKNNTNLSHQRVGNIIDTYLETNKGSTHYYGQITSTEYLLGNKKYELQVKYSKRYTMYVLSEIE